MKIVFTGVCNADLVQALYNELQPEQVACIGRLIQTANPLDEIASYRYEIEGAREAASQFVDESIDLVWVGNTDDNQVVFERQAWLPKLKVGGRLVCQHIYRSGDPVEIGASDNNFPDNWYLVKA